MNTVRNVWAILAQSSSIDRDNNTLSLFEILEEVTFQVAGKLPDNAVLPVNSQLVSFWERETIGEQIEIKLKIVLRGPAGQVLSENEGTFKMEPSHKRSRFRAQFQGMPMVGPGIYHYEIVSLDPSKTNNKEVLASVPLEVKVTAQPIKSPINL